MGRYLVIVAMLLGTVAGDAQVTVNVLNRVVRIRTTSGLCSGFTIDLLGRQYLVTAKHCIPTAAPGEVRLEWWHYDRWNGIQGRPIFASSADVDIVAFGLSKAITVQYQFEATLDGVMAGQQVYFAGYPFGLASRGGVPGPAGFGELPFLKSGILSALDSRNPGAVVLYVDGQNNPGFSGGPIVFRDSRTGPFRGNRSAPLYCWRSERAG